MKKKKKRNNCLELFGESSLNCYVGVFLQYALSYMLGPFHWITHFLKASLVPLNLCNFPVINTVSDIAEAFKMCLSIRTDKLYG